MARRLTIGLLLIIALFLAPLMASTPSCAMGRPIAQGMSCADCCAMMKSCVLPKQNPTNVVTTTPANPFVFATIAPIAAVSLGDSLAKQAPHPAAPNPRAGYAHSRRAVLCTFLI